MEWWCKVVCGGGKASLRRKNGELDEEKLEAKKGNAKKLKLSK